MDQRQVSLPRNPASGGSVSHKSPKAGALPARTEASLSLSVGSGLKVAGSSLLLEPLPRSVDALRIAEKAGGGLEEQAADRTGRRTGVLHASRLPAAFGGRKPLKPASTHQRGLGGRCALQPHAWLWRPLVVPWSFCNFQSSFLGMI